MELDKEEIPLFKNEVGFNRKHIDRVSIVLAMGVVVVFNQLQMPDTLTTGNTTGMRTKPTHAVIDEAIRSKWQKEVIHSFPLSVK
ncbi:hypothetical protein C7K08_11105 [Synechococcus lacustris str. Tous]|uniref:Uncharacterized protein n=1 Tax=Synechococcus lacustris str. Tous TaxID=1910958 RepID=A0A2P7EC90_9SYNE|nr:hypothetical protein C7K08_11105 [Synechococcus lacustris str. Tous]